MPVKILMPALSPTMTEGKLSKWLKKEGDNIKSGDIIAEIETDKATMEVEAVDEGILGKILIADNTENVPVNALIGVILEEGENASGMDEFLASNKGAPAQKQNTENSAAAARPAAGSSNHAPRRFASKSSSRVAATPLAKRVAEQLGVNLNRVEGTGPHGRIVRADVEEQQKNQASAPAAKKGPDAKQLADMLGMEYEVIPNGQIRKIVAQRLTESKQTVPHFYLTVECDIDALLAARKELNAKNNSKISVNDMVIKAAALALKEVPAANASWTDEAILQYKHADISIAVATPTGLITPIIKKAEELPITDISTKMKDLAARARDNKLKPEEFQGGSFSISNLGMFGIKNFQAIINPPQGCILAVGAGEQTVVVRDGQMAIATIMNCTLSVDHRVVDGAVGAEYMSAFKKLIQNPINWAK